jgi:triacylglycerol lipase
VALQITYRKELRTMAELDYHWTTLHYSKKNAYWLAKMSLLAYESSADIRKQLEKWELPEFYEISNPLTSTEGFIAGNDEALFLVFRGTMQPQDWITNVTAFFQPLILGPGGFGSVHLGNLLSLESVWQDVWDIIRDQKAGRALWLTGHSLGGALATLAAAKLAFTHNEPINGLYTFGQPRVRDLVFAISFNGTLKSRTFRYVNHNDVGTRLPPPPIYLHNGSLRYFDSAGEQQDDPGVLERISSQMEGGLEDMLTLGIADHDMHRYIENLDRAIGQRDAEIVQIDYNPPGYDIEAEHVIIVNNGTLPLNMTGWTLRDLANHVFHFPGFNLEPNERVAVWTGPGARAGNNLYWGRGQAVWNNREGDTAVLRDVQGNEVHRYSYAGD